jgi:hypothetical protein
MVKKKLVSVVIPSYNHARFIAQAIRSVLDQDYPALELIVVDDGSTDNSPDIIQFAIGDDGGRPVRFVRQENAGAHAAIMHGLRMARGEILTILNSDDMYEASRFTKIMATVPAQGDFIAFSKVRFIDDNGEPMGPETGIANWYRKAWREAEECPTIGFGLLRNNFSLTSGNLVFTRGLYETVGGFNSYKMCHDWDFLMRATHYVEPICVESALIDYRVHQSNTLHSTQHLQLEEGIPAINAFIQLGLAEPPPNPLCPGWAYWPLYFDHFIDSRSSWFSDAPIRNFLSATAPPPAFPVPDCGFLTTTAVPGTALDAFAFARDAAVQKVQGQQRDCCRAKDETPSGPRSMARATADFLLKGVSKAYSFLNW